MILSETHTEEDVSLETRLKSKSKQELVLFNDDYHTFDFVIESLVKVCQHSSLQAEQCTMLVHYKGKCSVKIGSRDYLRPFGEALAERGLSVEIS